MRLQQSDSIDITHLAIALIKDRLSDSFRLKEKRDHDMIDEPTRVAPTARPPINWFSGICLAAFLTTICASGAAGAQTGVGGLNPAEEWVVAQVTAGQNADLSKRFPDDKEKRKLSAHFLENLLTGALADVKPPQNVIRIFEAVIEERVYLQNAQIPCEVWLARCQFKNSVLLADVSFARSVWFESSVFRSFLFHNTKVGETASFRNVVFEDGAVFDNADIVSDFRAEKAQFTNHERPATFRGIRIRGSAIFSNAVFEGPINFGSADIASNFEVDGTQFQNKEKEANFNSMKVGGIAIFRNAVFEGPVNFGLADITSNFEAQGAKFQNKQKGASFGSMKIRGNAFFSNAVFEGPVSFSYADFAWLDVSGASWPKVAAEFQMQGMSYKYIRAAPGNEPESHKALLKLADQSVYTADVYSKLEEFFLRQGYPADGDQAFIAGKRRERKENLTGFDWVGSLLLDGLVGYGRHPSHAGYLCALFVALGCFLFSSDKMEPQKPDDAPRVYSRFWYSLGLFLPFVDLQADKVWKPKADQTFLRNYMRVHILAGWILIPIVLAALTGLIK
jgi:uncharacterized protein YjbI with pentapeptide repeats